MSERAIGQRVRHFGLDLLLAARAPIAVDGVLDGLGFPIFGNVFEDARTRLTRAFQRPTAIRAGGKLDCFVSINLGGPFWPPRFLPRALVIGLAYGGREPEGVCAATGRSTGPSGHDGTELQHEEDDGGPIEKQSHLGRRWRQRAGAKGREKLRIGAAAVMESRSNHNQQQSRKGGSEG